jgi:hypothetical protein
MTGVEPTEIEELRGRVLEIIGAYGMGVSNPRELYSKKTARSAPPPETVPVLDGGYIRDGVVQDRASRREDDSGGRPRETPSAALGMRRSE